MLRSLAIVAALAGIAHADDPLYKCKAITTGTMSVQFAPNTSVHDLAIWVMGFTCKNVVFSADVPKYATKVTVVSGQAMTPAKAVELFVASLEAANLVVVTKGDTMTIKLGPNAPKNCPDVAVAPKPATPTPTPVPPSPEADGVADAELDKGIKKIDATHVTVTKALVEKVLQNPMAIAKGARVVPAMKEGKTVGFKLYAIRAGSVWERLGFQNGDTLLKINGIALDSADKGLEAYTKLREATKFEISIERAGKPITLSIKII